MTKSPLIAAAAILLTACSPQGTPREPASAPANAADVEAAAVTDIQQTTEIAVLKRRVETLEREVGELTANPQALDLDLLTRRIERLEAGAAADTAVTAPTALPRPDPDQAQRAVDAAIAERRTRRQAQD